MGIIRSREVKYLAAFSLYLASIFVVSHMSAEQLQVIKFRVWDKGIHFLEYIPLGYLFTRWYMFSRIRKGGTLKLIGIALGVIVALSVFDELHQYFVPGRDTSMGDIIADVLGGATGIIMALGWFRMKEKWFAPGSVNTPTSSLRHQTRL